MGLEICGFEHLHRHTDFSLLDGYATVEEYAARSKTINQDYLCISDHGVMGCIPRQIKASQDHNLHPIFACEMYVNPLQPKAGSKAELDLFIKDLDPDQVKKLRRSAHLLAIAYNEEGYKNLVRLTSWAWINGYYYKPRVNHEVLKAHKEGIIFTSCCYNSEVGQAFERGGAEEADEVIARYMAMFGQNYYLEIMLLDFSKQKPYDKYILSAAERFRLPFILTQDCHYCNQEDSQYQRLMLMIQTGRTIEDIQRAKAEDNMQDFFELQDENLWLKSEEELDQKWQKDYSDAIDYELFKQAKRTTVEICRKAKGVKLDRSMKLPQLPDAEERLKVLAIEGLKKRNVPKTVQYRDRLKEELSLICRKGFSSYFLIQKMMTDEARRICPSKLGWGDGSEAVGCGRGSAVGSLTCYLLGITDVDPIKHDLLFSRFLSPARGGRSIKLRFTNIDPILPEAA
jgi:DNA polymerase-3 subunit alpha